MMRAVGHPQGLCFSSEQSSGDLYGQGHTVHPISIKHPRVTPSWSSVVQEMMQAPMNYTGCESNNTATIPSAASDKDQACGSIAAITVALHSKDVDLGNNHV